MMVEWTKKLIPRSAILMKMYLWWKRYSINAIDKETRQQYKMAQVMAEKAIQTRLENKLSIQSLTIDDDEEAIEHQSRYSNRRHGRHSRRGIPTRL